MRSAIASSSRKNCSIRQRSLEGVVKATCRSIMEPLESRRMFASTLLGGTPFGLIPTQTNRRPEFAFDANTATYYQADLQNGAYVGIDLGNGNTASVNRIKFAPVGNYGSVMVGGAFEGSSNGSDWTTLAPITSSIPSTGADWSITASAPYRYLRYKGTDGSYARISELEFYTDVPTTAPTAPSNLTATPTSATSVNLAWNDNSENETGFEIERRIGLYGAWNELTTVDADVAAYNDSGLPQGQTVYYRVRADDAVGDWCYSNEVSITTAAKYDKLTGTPTSSTVGAGSAANVFDGDTNTYFRSQVNNGSGFVTLNLGTGNAKVVNRIRFHAANAFEYRMAGAKFQASNNGTSWTDLHTIVGTPDRGWNDVYLSNTQAYQYYRYTGGASYTHVAEIEYHERSTTTAPSGLEAIPTLGKVSLNWDSVTGAVSYNIYRSTSAGREGSVAYQNVAGTSFEDTSVTAGATYYYTVSAVYPMGESVRSEEASATLPSTATAVKINFQTASTPSSPDTAGYLVDSGAIFGNRGNGYSYGWDVDNSANMRNRDALNAFDERYDTFGFLQTASGNRTWKFAGVSGVAYQVRVVSGDPAGTSENLHTLVNGLEVIPSVVAGNVSQFFDHSIMVTPGTDGLITVSNGSEASGNRIQFIEITPVSTLAAPTAVPMDVTTAASNYFSVDVRWDYTPAGGDNVAGFKIERAWDGDGIWREVGVVGSDQHWFNDVRPAGASADWQLWADRSFTYRVRAFNMGGDGITSSTDISVNPDSHLTTPGIVTDQLPYNATRTPWSIANRIEAENFDIGGDGLGWDDLNTSNFGGVYRNTGVDVTWAAPAGTTSNRGYMVSWTRETEWTAYTIDVPTAGTYDFQASIAYHFPGGTFHLEFIDGTNPPVESETITIPDTDGFHTFQLTDPVSVTIPAGVQTMKIVVDSINEEVGNAGNIDWFELTPIDIPPGPVITIEAADSIATESGETTGTYTLTRTGDPSTALTVNVAVNEESTASSGDYTGIGTTAIFAAGESTSIVTLTSVDDAIEEGDETLILTLVAGSGYTVGSPFNATVTIQDDDVTTPTVPAPVNLQAAVATTTQVNLDWDDAAAAGAGFHVYRGTTSDFTPDAASRITTLPVNESRFADSAVPSVSTYYYKVTTVVGGVESVAAATPAQNLAVTPAAPEAPSDVEAVALSSTELQVTWSDNSLGEAGFILQISSDGGTTWTPVPGDISTNATSFLVGGLSAGTTYVLALQAVNDGGTSQPPATTNPTTTPATNPSDTPWGPAIPKEDVLVILVSGHTQNDGDNIEPHLPKDTSGIHSLFNKLRTDDGFTRIREFSEDPGNDNNDIQYNPTNQGDCGKTLLQIVEYITEQFVATNPNRPKALALIGYSHGAGLIYEIAQNIRNNIPAIELRFTAYIDAINNPIVREANDGFPLPKAERRMPPKTERHVNYYQSVAIGQPNGDSMVLQAGESMRAGDEKDMDLPGPFAQNFISHSEIGGPPPTEGGHMLVGEVHQGIRTKLLQAVGDIPL